ncbi:MAG: hypothetical protein IT536_15140 [Hyphomicrobiales bacterium]|nr:hypothetical protein [Hyphomicrobiales bacterium]
MTIRNRARTMRNWLAPCAAAVMIVVYPALAEFAQQGEKLVGAGADGAALQGLSVALSANGRTALIGGYADSGLTGAGWIFTRSGDGWGQQGAKLVGAGVRGFADQGFSVALSADGNTALLGGHGDDNYAGATWVFARDGGEWKQQGEKLWGAGVSRARAQQGISVALSADGNTALVGGHGADRFVGGAWVFTRSNGVWAQQGSRLLGAGAVGEARQGWSVALSADGNTALVGGHADDFGAGAAWVFQRSGGVWTRQGGKLVGTGASGAAQQGWSVALSADGDTALLGGPDDNGHAGAAWIFTRTGASWTQRGDKLVGAGAVGPARQGSSVALSGDGGTAVVGGFADDGLAGAAWLFARKDGRWIGQGDKLVGAGAAGKARQGRSVAISADGGTILIGGFGDNANAGAAWVMVRRPQP